MKTRWAVLVSLFLFPGMLYAQEDAARTLDSVVKAYAGLKDFTAAVNIHYDTEAMKAPDMKATFYYKAPDQMKVDAKGIFFLPKEGAFFNPFMFKPEDFEITPMERLMVDARKAARIRLISKKTRRINQDYILTIDTERHLIREMAISQFGGRVIKANIDYGRVEGFQLPTRIEILLDMPPAESNETRESGPFMQRGRRITGKVEITYSDYKVNSGLSDEIFKETKR